MHLVLRKSCRVCGSASLNQVIDLGEQYLQGSFIKPGKPMPPTRRIPTTLVRCDPSRDENACGLLQMAFTLPPQILYSTYWYRSGTNQTMRLHLRGIAEEAAKISGKKDCLVLDIGCNDGTLLSYYPKSFVKFGIDPSDIAGEIKDEVNIIQDLFPSQELNVRVGGKRFDIITAIAMFYDLEDPISFVREIKSYLAPDGLWIFEMSYMPTMLKMNSYDTICHEHLEYYSLAVVEYILKRSGMKLIRATLNDSNGGSIRCFATHEDNFRFKNHEFQEGLEALRRQELDMELDTDKPYKDFQARIIKMRDELFNLLLTFKKEGKQIHVYGASTKGNTILQFCGLDKNIIDYAADRNPEKHGARTIGTDIPIISEEESRSKKPDYYLVLPWHFKNEFLEREKDVLRNGTKMIFPLPEIKVF